jgi:glycosyltransferase involved in cell wall biosynthesis
MILSQGKPLVSSVTISMRIGLDGFPLVSPKTGVGHYTFELARELAKATPEHCFELIAPAPFPESVLADLNPIPNLSAVSVKTNALTRRWWAIGLPRYVSRARLDLFHGTNYEVPLRNRRRNVVTVHDLSILLHPDKHDARIARRARRRLPIMIRNAARIITPTEAIKRELCDHFKIDPQIVRVTPEAPRKSFHRVDEQQSVGVRQRLCVGDNFILYVGTIEPRKNLSTLVRACREILQHTTHRPQLVIAGGAGWLRTEFDQLLADGDFLDRVLLTGYLDDGDLRALYSSCKLFVYPSLYEGFGLPPLEAMACGAPVIASRIATFEETLDGNAQLVAPNDEHALAQAIVHLLENEVERQTLAARGLARAAQFSWKKTAELTLSVYEELLQQ